MPQSSSVAAHARASSAPSGAHASAGPPPPPQAFKVVILGDSTVGKTCLVRRIVAGRDGGSIDLDTLSTVGVDLATVVRQPSHGGLKARLQIWDTAGQERYRSIAESFYRGAAGIVLVYDVTRRGTFSNIELWLSSIAAHSNGAQLVLLGNKLDLAEAAAGAREVTAAGGAAAAAQLGLPFFEVSARTGAGVEEAFDELARRLLERAAAPPPRDGGARAVDFSSLADREASAAAAKEGCSC